MAQKEYKCDNIFHKKDPHMAQSKMVECFKVGLIEKSTVGTNIRLVLPSIDNNTVWETTSNILAIVYIF